MTPARLRPLAETDLVARSRYHLVHAGDDVAARFFDAAVEALRAAERMPGTGSPRIGEICGIRGLRVWRIEHFPCGWFYFVRPDHLDVVRILADAQNLTAILNAFNEE